MAFREVRDEGGRLVCTFDPTSAIIEVKRRGDSKPLRADLTPYLREADCWCERTEESRPAA